jgi:hypothetical protein
MSLLIEQFREYLLDIKFHFTCHQKFYQYSFLVLLLPVLLLSSTVPSLYLPQGYVISALSARGYNPSILTTSTTLGCSNPAALIDLNAILGFHINMILQYNRLGYLISVIGEYSILFHSQSDCQFRLKICIGDSNEPDL